MDIMQNLGLLLGGSWASGVNLYLTTAGLGIAGRMGLVELPGNLDVVSNPLVIAAALGIFAIEFFADKVPIVDSAWDSIHTLIRPIGGASLAYLGMADAGPIAQTIGAMMGGTVALDSHLTKATARVAINTSPEPFTNSVASVSEDMLVVSMMYLAMKHPVLATIAVIFFIAFSIWFLIVMFKFLKKALKWLFKLPETTPSA